MKCTISTHNGTQIAIEHNLRNRKVTDKEKHIDRYGDYEVWYHENIRKAYNRLFGEALKEYNNNQVRDDRKIKSYYEVLFY